VTVFITKDDQKQIEKVMKQIVDNMVGIFGNELRQVILFGSYARGEQAEYSDMDVMVLVNVSNEALSEYSDALAEVMTAISLEYGVLPTIIDKKNYDHFYHWMPILPFYHNVKAEGTEFYAN